MIALTLEEIAQLVGGGLRDAAPGTVVRGPVEFDTRRPLAGGLFVAFAGERADGHDFAADAYRAGALACIVTRPVAGPRIEVADPLAALTALAAAVARRLTAVVVEITGSSGKTTTKDMAAHVLARLGPTVAPPGSFNNELGFPYTVLQADESTRVLVLEASARGLGHIRQLTEIAPPAIGVVLNVGTAHVGEFGSPEAIAQAKGELVEALPASGLAVLNADDPQVLAMRSRTAARVVTVGRSPIADMRADDVRADVLDRAAFRIVAGTDAAEVQLQSIGLHHVGNALAVAAVALECGLTLDETARALSDARPASRWRMEPFERADGVLVLNDAYNANPESMRAALEALASIAGNRGTRGIAVLGPMAELGPRTETEHERLGRLAVELGIARVVVVGEPARPISDAAALARSTGVDVDWVADADAAVALLRGELRPGDVVLVKASRAASLERVALAIADDPSQRAAGQTGGDDA